MRRRQITEQRVDPDAAAQRAQHAYYIAGPGMLEDGHGVSVFSKDADGTVYHTYSTYARGDMLVGTYNFLDLVPKGRDEDGFAFPMTWLRRHDQYDNYKVDAKAGYPMPAKAGHACCAAHGRQD